MTEKYYYEKPYLKELEATVTSICKKGLILDRTISYPEGGGQPGDRGFINGIPYSDTIHDGDDIIHIMSDSSSFNVGDKVTIHLDWDHRYDYMQQHTAQHLLSGILFNNYQIGTVSVHQGEDILTIETDSSFISDETLLKVESDAIDAINQNHKVYYQEKSHKEAEQLGLRRSIKVDGDVRIVVIEGVDKIACGGLHVDKTSEIKELSYAGSEMIRGHVRTIWRTGDRARRKRLNDAESIKKISALLSSPENKVINATEKLINELKDLKIKNRALEENAAMDYLQSKQENVFSTPYSLNSFIPNLKNGEYFITHLDNDRLGWLFYGLDSRFSLIKAKFKELGIKGGGREPLYQGVCTSLDEEHLLEEIKEILN